MTSRRRMTVDGNEAAASVAYRASETIAIYGRRGACRDARDAHSVPALLRRLQDVARGRKDRGAGRRRSARADRNAIDIVSEVKRSLRIPVADNLAPLLTAFAHFAKSLDQAGADALVMFMRFHRIDIDVDELEVVRSLPLSDSAWSTGAPQ